MPSHKSRPNGITDEEWAAKKKVYQDRWKQSLLKNPIRLEVHRSKQAKWAKDKYHSLTENQKKLFNFRSNHTYKQKGLIFSLCNRCRLWRQSGHDCVADRARIYWQAYWQTHSREESLAKALERRREYNRNRVKKSKQSVESVSIPQYWPYGVMDWPINIVSPLISMEMPEYIRADIGQELCLMILMDEVKEENLFDAYTNARKKAYGPWTRSLDAPIGEDNFTLGDLLVAPDDEYDI